MPRALFSCLLALVLPAAANASSPEEVTKEYFAAIQQHGMSTAVEYMHPEELAKFQEMVLPIFALEEESGQAELRTKMFGRTATVESVANARPHDFMKRFLLFFAEATHTLGGIDFDEIEVLGSVPEGEVVHVVARTSVGVGEIRASGMEVISWKRHGSGWKALLSGEMQGLAQGMLQAAREQQAAETP